jgi:hypothetical protein
MEAQNWRLRNVASIAGRSISREGNMKRSAILHAMMSMMICLSGTSTTLGQQSCEFNIVGTWRTSTSDGADSPWLYQFTLDGMVTALARSGSGEASTLRAAGGAAYALDDPKRPTSITFTASDENDVFAYGKSSMDVTGFDDMSFTSLKRGSSPVRWSRVDPNRYFIVLAARSGEFYDSSGSAFPMLIRMAGSESRVDAVGTYSLKGKRAFGPVPPEAYGAFLSDARRDSEVMLRLEINAAQYHRALTILRTWERRVREDALLYPTGSPLNNVLLVKAVTETLNQCSDEIKLYQLNYLHPEDWIADKYAPQDIPLAYFRELRRLNDARHVRVEELQHALPAVAAASH